MHSFNDIDYDIQDLAYKCYFGGHFEIFYKGNLENIHHADINSAYPFAMAQIPNGHPAIPFVWRFWHFIK